MRARVRPIAATDTTGWVAVSENVRQGHDLDAALALVVAAGAKLTLPCIELFPMGTPTGISLNGKQLACTNAVAGGQTLASYLANFASTASAPAIAALLVAAGVAQSKATARVSPYLDFGKTLPTGCVYTGYQSITCTYPSETQVIRPIIAPPQQDQLWLQNQRAKAPIDVPTPTPTVPGPVPAPQDFATTDDYKNTAAEECQASVVRWGAAAGVPDDACSTMPIFFTGLDTPKATEHDLNAIIANPAWFMLSYVKSAEKTRPRNDWSSTPPCNAKPDARYDCDEYPYYASANGYPDFTPSLEAIPRVDNQLQGSKYGTFVSTCARLRDSVKGTPDRRFLVVPVPWLPTSNYCPVP